MPCRVKGQFLSFPSQLEIKSIKNIDENLTLDASFFTIGWRFLAYKEISSLMHSCLDNPHQK